MRQCARGRILRRTKTAIYRPLFVPSCAFLIRLLVRSNFSQANDRWTPTSIRLHLKTFVARICSRIRAHLFIHLLISWIKINVTEIRLTLSGTIRSAVRTKNHQRSACSMRKINRIPVIIQHQALALQKQVWRGKVIQKKERKSMKE